jgi:hypothetical protein
MSFSRQAKAAGNREPSLLTAMAENEQAKR